jgi:hypothetical protein
LWTYLGPLEWPCWAALVLLGHVMLAGLLYTSVWALEGWAHYLDGEKLPLIWGIFPREYLFQTMDVGVVSVFIVRGIVAAWRELGRNDRARQ